MTEIKRCLILSLALLVIISGLAPAFADSPHFTITGQAISHHKSPNDSGPLRVKLTIVFALVKPVGKSNCGDNLSGSCIIKVVSPSSIVIGTTAASITSGSGVLSANGINLTLCLSMQANGGTVSISLTGNLSTGMVGGTGRAFLRGTDYTLSFPLQPL